MSCNCNKCISCTIQCPPCGATCIGPLGPFCGRRGCPCKRQHSCRDKCRDKYRDECRKCRRRECECPEIVPCLRTHCGFITAKLTKTASPTTFSTSGTVITYSYTITNTGTDVINYPVQICDDKLGGWAIPCVLIGPGSSQTFTRTYTTTPSDLSVQTVTNTATANILVSRREWVCTNPASATITNLSFLTITTSQLPNATLGTGYSAGLSAIGGTSPYTWSLVSGTPPQGLSLNPFTGVIYGTPTAAGTFTFMIKVTDSVNNTAQATLSITVV